ncbi:DUF2268 domain-containing putative Zn-dependent protease [Pseudomonas yamanorum]|uniref:DUF2268 domain-containing putative Zn-dependent protease n=1 Tax=Pseudomonas yamanorum TaxID=515393 RepID=UPI00087ABA79|nr:DUF2268 domain-containing putative Zn-dependent protease [Pseudomonas yamanorum]SDT92822.1 Predicted Zn-dependent protease [Pseudomonas yamanorum]
MDAWTLHWLEASGSLAQFRAELIRECEVAYGAIAQMMPPPRLDILIQRLPGETLPELGLVGRAYRSTLFSMTLDPDNPNFLASLQSGALRRHVVHEVHHCLRMTGPGYGWTLGEAMVSEGLAGQFVRRVLGSEPELWERALAPQELLSAPVDRQLLEATYYDHSEWFFGTGARPRWLGYTLGYQMVEAWLAKQGDVDAATWVNVPAHDILANAAKEGLVA